MHNIHTEKHFTLCCSILCCKYKKPKKVKASGSSIVAVLYFEATDWQTYKEIKTEVRKIIAESKQYDKKYKDLEFTAISVEEYNGSSHDVLKYCLKALKMDGSDDNVTTIELKVKRYCENGVRTYIPEVFTCVYNYSLDNSKQNFYTENINLTIRTIKIRDMDDFEMVHRNFKSVNVLNNQIHKSFINCLRSKIENEITAYTNRHLYVLITKHLIQKIKKGKHCDAEKIVCDGNKYLQFRYNLFESSAKKEFIILAVDNIYTAISSTKEEMFEKIVEEVAKKVPIFQPNIECNYSKIGITRERVRYFYSQGFQNILLNYLRIGLDKILKKLEKLDVARLNSAYTKYVLWLKEKNIATEILPHQNRPENLVEEYRISNGESILEIAAFIEICRIGSVDNINYSGSLLKLKSTFHTSRAKIILRGKLTKNTIPTMCHILCHIPTPIDSVFQQIICINLNQSIDLNWVLDENKEIVIKENNKTGCSIHVGYCILKSNILMKKKDQIKVYKSTINTNNSREKTEAISKVTTSKDNNFTYDIQNLQKVMFGNKRVKFELHVKKNYTDRLGAGNTVTLNNRRKIIKICISSNLKLIKLEIKTSKDDQCINLRQKSFDIVTRKELMDIKYAGKFFKKKVDFLFDIKHPIRLVQYLKSIQALSYSSDIPVVDYHKKTELFIDNFAITIAGESPSNSSDLVRENLSKIQNSIRDAYQKNKNSQTFLLEIQLSDYLTQKIYPDKWIAIVGEFLRISGISLEFLDGVLSKFIIDTTVFEASCENDVHGIDTSNFTIIIVAKHICGCEPVIYMMMSLLTCDFGYMPMARILDFYCYVLKDTVYREKTHPLNSLGALTKAPKHPITYIFIVLFDPLSNLLKILDMESCYDTNIEIYKEVSEKILQCMRQDMIPSDTAKDRLGTSENLEPLDSIKLQEILSHEVFLLVERIKKYRDRVNSRTLINVAAFSREPSTRIDNEVIEELKSMLVKA